jgi:iron complex outermembrane receptor protein
MSIHRSRRHVFLHSLSLVALLSGGLACAGAAYAADKTNDSNGIRNSDDIIVTATQVNAGTPITSSITATSPMAIVSRSIIENAVPPTADISDVVLLTPGASGVSNGNGPGLSESKTVLRGFQDGQFNITYDGIPFGDSNDPTHHSTAYFPNGTYERIIIDRGPGGATDLGQSSYGGNIHIISRELSDKFGMEAEGVYGSYHSYLGRLTVNSGEIEKLNGLKIIAVGEYKDTKGALSNSKAWFVNGFVKAEMPLGDKGKFSILSSYNQDEYNQSDNNGITCNTNHKIAVGEQTDGNNCTAGSQVALYGKNFGLVDVTDPRFAGTPYPSARFDWNWTNKTTDFEIARFQWNFNDNISFDNKTYTYFYKNFTVSSESSTTPCTGGIMTASTCGGMKTINSALKTVANDIPGYTKVNQYRTSGDVAEVTFKTTFGTGKIGVWYESSFSHRYRYDYDLTTAFAANAFGDGHFDFAAMTNYYNYKETDKAFNVMTNGQPVPLFIKYDERTSWQQIQGFGEFEFHLFDDKLKITPGVKIQNFTRKINTPIAAQSTRVGINAQDSYKPTLPYATINYLIQPNFSVYAQFAKGFLIPSLGNSLETQVPTAGGFACAPGVTCNIQPTKTTNYQAGAVFAGDRLNIDADGYYIKTSNSTSVDPSTGVATQSTGPATYKGLEAQVSYLFLKSLTGIVNGSINTAKDDTSHMWLAQAPNYTALAGVIYNTGPLKLSYLHKFTGRQYADTAQVVRIAPYSNGIASASVTYGRVTVGVSVYNVFDDRSTTKLGSPTSTSALYFFQPGRSYEAQVKLKL